LKLMLNSLFKRWEVLAASSITETTSLCMSLSMHLSECSIKVED